MPRIIPEVLRNLFRKPNTVKYPYERREPPEGLRGKPVVDRGRCISCRLCSIVCPSKAITMDDEVKPVFDLGRCIFCGECADICPVKAITMTREFELAVFDKAEAVSK